MAVRFNSRPALGARTSPFRSQRITRVQCKSSDDKEGKDAKAKEEEELVKKTVKELRKADVDQAAAREVMKMWKESGVTDDPEELRKLYQQKSNASLGRFGIQLFLDAAACYAAYQAASAIDSGGDFFGRPVLVFIFSAVTFNYALAFVSNGLNMAISLRSMNRFGTNAAAYLEAIKEIAGPTSLDSVTKVQSVLDSLRIARALEKMDGFLKDRVESGGKMATVESLAVYFILSEAREKFGFKPEDYGLSDDDAVMIARAFIKYDKNDDGRIDSTELRSLCADAGKKLSEEETKAALKAIDENENGVIEFNEFVAFWVDPGAKVAELKEMNKSTEQEPATKGAEGKQAETPVS